MLRILALLLPVLVLGSPPADAVILAQGDGTQNTSAPADDPGFANVGFRGGFSLLYVGNRWVVTAAHVGVGNATFDGVTYEAIPESVVAFETSPGQAADLIAYKLREDPGLPPLSIASTTPSTNASAVLIGHGRNRGAATQWNGIDGWLWAASGYVTRWGTNRVSAAPGTLTIGSRVTRAFPTDFTKAPSPLVTSHEAQAADGDSGGALFVKNGGSWELAGMIFAIAPFVGQPSNTALYGNLSYAVDLSFYRSAILAATTQPACNDGLDDDADGLIDFPADPGCDSANDIDERSPLLVCDDGADNDGDGLVDFPADPGCKNSQSARENPACDDDLDNDGDGTVDWDGGAAHGTPDNYCVNNGSWQSVEKKPCGLGAELVVLVPLLARWRKRAIAA